MLMDDNRSQSGRSCLAAHLSRATKIARDQGTGYDTTKQVKQQLYGQDGTVGKRHEAHNGRGKTDWDRKKFAVSDLDAGSLECPNCAKPFSQQTWNAYHGFDSPGSGGWEYACPTRTCNTIFIFERSYD